MKQLLKSETLDAEGKGKATLSFNLNIFDRKRYSSFYYHIIFKYSDGQLVNKSGQLIY